MLLSILQGLFFPCLNCILIQIFYLCLSLLIIFYLLSWQSFFFSQYFWKARKKQRDREAGRPPTNQFSPNASNDRDRVRPKPAAGIQSRSPRRLARPQLLELASASHGVPMRLANLRSTTRTPTGPHVIQDALVTRSEARALMLAFCEYYILRFHLSFSWN